MKTHINNELTEALKYNLSFAGCGFLGIYHVGVAVCFKKYAPQLLLQKISGASAGTLAATCLLTDMPLGEMTSDFFRIVNQARASALGPFSPSFNIQECLLEGMSKHLPEDAHIRVSGKLHISLTRVYDGQNVIVSNFNSREDLLNALLCACFIPGFSGFIPPKFHGIRYMDGAFSDNLPILDENTVTVSPFCGESDICPRDDTAQIFHVNLANTSIELSKQNIYRFIRILFPPKPEILSNMCQQGFDDALHFLHRNNLISCTRCLAIQSTFILSKQTPEHYDPQCTTCSFHRDESLVDRTLPDTVLMAMEKYIRDKSNSVMFRWFQQSMPVDLMYAIVSRLFASAPAASLNFWELTKYAMENIHRIFILQDRRPFERDEYSERLKSIYEGDPILKKFERVGPRRSIIDLYPSDVDEQDFEFRGHVLSRRNSAAVSVTSHHNGMSSSFHSALGDVDRLDQVANLAAHHDTIYEYHYMDETDKTMKFSRIFDMTESDSSSVGQQLSETEHDANQLLQFDDSEMIMPEEEEQSIIQHDLDLLLPESKEIMSNWTCAEIKVDEIISNENESLSQFGSTSSIESTDSFYKPEADQSEHEQYLSENVVNALKRDTKDTLTIARDIDE